MLLVFFLNQQHEVCVFLVMACLFLEEALHQAKYAEYLSAIMKALAQVFLLFLWQRFFSELVCTAWLCNTDTASSFLRTDLGSDGVVVRCGAGD